MCEEQIWLWIPTMIFEYDNDQKEKEYKHAKLYIYDTLIRYKLRSFDLSMLYVIAYHWSPERFIYITADE